MQVQFSKSTPSTSTSVVGTDSPDVMFNQFLAYLLGDAPSDTYTSGSASGVKNLAETATNANNTKAPLETVQRVFNQAKGAKMPSITSAVKIGVGAMVKAALVTPFYAICRLLGMPKLTFMERAAVIGGNSVYQGYVKPVFALNA